MIIVFYGSISPSIAFAETLLVFITEIKYGVEYGIEYRRATLKPPIFTMFLE